MIKEISVNELSTKLQAKEDFVLLDVREKDEWDSGHIKEAKFFPMSEAQSNLNQIMEHKDHEIILQCKSGMRSMNVATFLLGEGFSNLSNLEGGIMSWVNEGNPVE
jgi:rhodanese-related sulfurtransferase